MERIKKYAVRHSVTKIWEFFLTDLANVDIRRDSVRILSDCQQRGKPNIWLGLGKEFKPKEA